jgi:hypothetical protein
MLSSSFDRRSKHPFRFAEEDADGRLFVSFETADGIPGRVIRPADGKAARRVKTGFQKCPNTILVNDKFRLGAAAESTLEADAYREFALTKRIVSIRDQPYEVEYRDFPRTIRTYPDVELTFSDGGVQIVQIKSERFLEQARENPRFRNEREIFEKLGWSYRIVTEKEIQVEPKLSNMKFLWQYLNRQVPTKLTAEIAETLGRKGTMTASELLRAFIGSQLHFVDLVALAAQERLEIDLSKKFGPSSRVSIAT